jgi:hypothetical protein
VGTSLAQTMQERRDQFHTLRLGESLDVFNAAVVSFLEQARGVFGTADRRSSCRAAAGLAGTRSAPAVSMSICLLRCLFDVDRGDAL